jgi:IPT/TIG domain
MTETPVLERRQFLRNAVVVAGVGLTGFGASNLVRAAAATTTQAWVLDPAWGFPKGAHGRTSCSCHACITHAANKVFASHAAADSARAHAGCLCEPEAFDLRTTIYDAVFTTPGVLEVDRRDPDIADLLGPGMDTQVDAFNPGRGRVGDHVVLTGRHFSGAVGVTFHGVPAVFGVDSDHQISTTVPPGASAGIIAVEMPDGTVKASGPFAVRHPRSVSMKLGEATTHGKVSVLDGFTPCREGVLVLIQRLEEGTWTNVAGIRTQLDGHYRVRPMTVPGSYRAVAKWKRLPAGDLCMHAVSPQATK